jgi:hypothetical protein
MAWNAVFPPVVSRIEDKYMFETYAYLCVKNLVPYHLAVQIL